MSRWVLKSVHHVRSAYILSSASAATAAFLRVRGTEAHVGALVVSLACRGVPPALEGPLFLNARADFLMELTHLLLQFTY